MFNHTRISRRGFVKLNAIIGGALAVSVALPAVATAAAAAIAAPSATGVDVDADDILSHAPAIRFGTPTDVAATWTSQAWSVDAEGVIRRFDRAARAWLPDGADEADHEADFPAGSQFVLARWGRPSGPNQMLMVLGPAAGMPLPR